MSPRQRRALICLALAVLTAFSYAEVRRHEFVNFDDGVYVTDNLHVKSGLSGAGLRWAWSTFHGGNWHPLTWMALQLDATLFGTWAGGFHLTNLALHIVNVVLLFAVLERMTGAAWRSALVAALFAVHPIHVESVAWVTERKDVLSTLFWLLALAAYLGYVRRPGAGRYLLVVAAMALGLLAKPMLVTLPCVLLLLDYWPLGRRALLEKLPLFGLAAVVSVVTVIAQRQAEAVASWEALPWPARLGNALVAYVRYLIHTLVPSGLAPYYPHPGTALPAWQVAGAVVLLASLTALFVWGGRRRPYLAVGWLWFLGTLVPVIGLVQVGAQALADRYAYVPNIGLYIMLAWGVHDLLARRQAAPAAGGVLAAVLVTVCTALTMRQVPYWHDSQTLWERALAVTSRNVVAHNNLGEYLTRQASQDDRAGQRDAAARKYRAAARHFTQALEIVPEHPQAHYNLAEVHFQLRQLDEAARHYQAALQADPRLPNAPRAQQRLGLIFLHQGNLDEARARFQRALEIDRNLTDAHGNLGVIALRQGRPEDAVRHAADLLEINPQDAEGHNLLGVARGRLKQWREAAAVLRRVVELGPDNHVFRCNHAHALYHLGEIETAREEYQKASETYPDWLEEARVAAWRLATSPDAKVRDAAEAVHRAEQACQATDYRRPELLDTLAAAQAEAGLFDEAAATARRALAAAGQTDLAAPIQQRLLLYEKGQPFRAAPDPPP